MKRRPLTLVTESVRVRAVNKVKFVIQANHSHRTLINRIKNDARVFGLAKNPKGNLESYVHPVIYRPVTGQTDYEVSISASGGENTSGPHDGSSLRKLDVPYLWPPSSATKTLGYHPSGLTLHL
ncbi:hypothetical protein RRG08_015739 [Elysia crispata]|uniref:Uncharacterized protein n=1 Tax=Elysia crispata TaxID=231223 RepID=A0AAE0YS45_9GAST|nr:hypothetical protein RRG08_015739 [Elysia crispata]